MLRHYPIAARRCHECSSYAAGLDLVRAVEDDESDDDDEDDEVLRAQQVAFIAWHSYPRK